MIELKNISLLEYLELDDRSEYDFALRYAYMFNKPIDHFKIGDFMKCKFGIIKDIQYDIQEGLKWDQLIDYIELLTGIKSKEIASHKLLLISQVKSYIITEIEKIIEVERISLSYDHDEKEERAGIESLAVLGVYLQIRSLTGGDVTKNEAVRDQSYENCFTELITQKRLYDYNKRYNQIVS